MAKYQACEKEDGQGEEDVAAMRKPGYMLIGLCKTDKSDCRNKFGLARGERDFKSLLRTNCKCHDCR